MVASNLSSAPPDALCRESDVNRRRFLFRCFYVPVFAHYLVLKAAAMRETHGPLWWMYEFSTYYVAFERMFLEMLIDDAEHKRPAAVRIPKNLKQQIQVPCADVRYFQNAAGDWKWWEGRFDVWHRAAGDSVRHFLKSQDRHIGSYDEAGDRAAVWGVIESLRACFENAVTTHLPGV